MGVHQERGATREEHRRGNPKDPLLTRRTEEEDAAARSRQTGKGREGGGSNGRAVSGRGRIPLRSL